MAKTKVAIIGGGVGGLSAAFELSQTEALRERYEVTVYQDGWVLGGKAATGRNPRMGWRTEEHGLHMLMGFYDNLFTVLKQAYKEVDRHHWEPLARWDQAFKRRSFAVFQEKVLGEWKPWGIEFPETLDEPGLPHQTLWQEVIAGLRRIESVTEEQLSSETAPEVQPPASLIDRLRKAKLLAQDATRLKAIRLPSVARMLAEQLPAEAVAHDGIDQRTLVWLLAEFTRWLMNLIDQSSLGIRHIIIILNLATTVIKGILKDHVLTKGFEAINDKDLVEWLEGHGADFATCAPIRGFYGGGFAFTKGDERRPSLAAGAGLAAMMRTFLGYKGAVMWDMQAGMGETVITPLFQALQKRGVKFQFFRPATKVTVSTDNDGNKWIETILLGKQADVHHDLDYVPLVNVKGLPCWPSEPDYNQLLHGDIIKAARPRIHQKWPLEVTSFETLRRGHEFDAVVLAVPPPALEGLAEELFDANEDWREMRRKLPSVHTIGVQLWLTKTPKELGWTLPPPVLGGFADPIDTYADMSHVLKYEEWPENNAPRGLVYLCDQVIPEMTDEEALFQITRTWIETNLRWIWPKAIKPNGTFDWNVLYDPENRTGPDRLRAQYLTLSNAPTNKYVQSPPDSIKARLDAGNTGFGNLFLGGDWVRTGIDMGCAEGACIGGLTGARALLKVEAFPPAAPAQTVETTPAPVEGSEPASAAEPAAGEGPAA